MEHIPSARWTTASSLRRRPVGPADSAELLRRWGPWGLAGLAFVVLMASFLAVLQQAVARGEHQRQVTAQQAGAEWRCRTESTLALRRSCAAGKVADEVTAALH